MIASRGDPKSTLAVLSARVDIPLMPPKPRVYSEFREYQDPENHLQNHQFLSTLSALKSTPSVAMAYNTQMGNHLGTFIPQSINQPVAPMPNDSNVSEINPGTLDLTLATEFWMDFDPFLFTSPFDNFKTAQSGARFDSNPNIEFEMWSTTPSGNEFVCPNTSHLVVYTDLLVSLEDWASYLHNMREMVRGMQGSDG